MAFDLMALVRKTGHMAREVFRSEPLPLDDAESRTRGDLVRRVLASEQLELEAPATPEPHGSLLTLLLPEPLGVEPGEARHGRPGLLRWLLSPDPLETEADTPALPSSWLALFRTEQLPREPPALPEPSSDPTSERN